MYIIESLNVIFQDYVLSLKNEIFQLRTVKKIVNSLSNSCHSGKSLKLTWSCKIFLQPKRFKLISLVNFCFYHRDLTGIALGFCFHPIKFHKFCCIILRSEVPEMF